MTYELQTPSSPEELDVAERQTLARPGIDTRFRCGLDQVANDNEMEAKPEHSEFAPVPSLYSALRYQWRCPYMWWES